MHYYSLRLVCLMGCFCASSLPQHIHTGLNYLSLILYARRMAVGVALERFYLLGSQPRVPRHTGVPSARRKGPAGAGLRGFCPSCQRGTALESNLKIAFVQHGAKGPHGSRGGALWCTSRAAGGRGARRPPIAPVCLQGYLFWVLLKPLGTGRFIWFTVYLSSPSLNTR